MILMPIWLFLMVIETNIHVVLGYLFVAKLNPQVGWMGRWVRVKRKGKVFYIPVFQKADLFWMIYSQRSREETPPMALDVSSERLTCL